MAISCSSPSSRRLVFFSVAGIPLWVSVVLVGAIVTIYTSLVGLHIVSFCSS